MGAQLVVDVVVAGGEGATDLDEDHGDDEAPGAGREGGRDGGVHDEPAAHGGEDDPSGAVPSGQGHRRLDHGEGPDREHGEPHDDGLGDTGPGEVLAEVAAELGDGEGPDEVEEELEGGDWLAPATAASASTPSGPSGAPASSASSSGSVGASGASSFTQDLRGTWEQGGAGGDAGAIVRGREDPPCTRQSPLTLATFRSWGIHWMTSHEGPGESVPDGGGAPVRSPVTRG